MKLLIIGGVAGGASAAARARRLDESAEIAERNCQVHLLTPIVVFYALHSPVQM
jgi:NADPH-dependent 2,4-dienoyl-CoA reductase/sulfur reductase-like enzyme